MRHRAGPLVTAVLMLAALAGMRATMHADTQHVWFLGQRAGSECAFRHHFGVPCPNCGMSRSLVMTIQGDVQQAALLNPAGPLLVGGVIAMALMLLGFAAPSRNTTVARWVLPSVLVYAAIYIAVLIGHWLMVVW